MPVAVFYPDAGSGATTVDGRVSRGGQDQAWSALAAGAGDTVFNSSNPESIARANASLTSGQWQAIFRSGFTFDTSGLSALGVVLAATLSVYGASKVTGNWTGTPDINVYGFTPASNNALVAADYGQCGSTAFSSPITYPDYSIVGYNDFVLNASGLAAVNRTGISRFSIRNANHDVAVSTPTWAGFAEFQFNAYMADDADQGKRPKLTVTYRSGNVLERVIYRSFPKRFMR